jgi:hypothetical protein
MNGYKNITKISTVSFIHQHQIIVHTHRINTEKKDFSLVHNLSCINVHATGLEGKAIPVTDRGGL